MMFCAGISIGALSVKAVALNGEGSVARVALHCGRPVETLRQMLAQAEFAGVDYFGVSGQLGHLTEVAAIRRALAASAWTAAVSAQEQAERALQELGRKTLDEAVAGGGIAILLAGRSYSAFAPEASQSVAKKLSSMGVTVIPGDCLASVEAGPTAWHFANQILNAAAIVNAHPNLFLLCVSIFSCTIDAFTQSILASEMGSKPHLILEIDAHTADAGIQIRLEAFLDIVANYRTRQTIPIEPFNLCRLAPGGRVVRTNGETVRLDDPRVKIRFPNFSHYHSENLARAARWLGLNVGETVPLDRDQLERGLDHTSGRECLPLPICIGQLLQISESRPPDEITGFYMVRGGAPCVSDCYMGYFERFIAEQRLPDLFLLNPQKDNDWCGLDRAALVQSVSPAIQVADILVEIEQVLRAVGRPGSVDQLRARWRRFLEEARTLDEFNSKLPAFADGLAALPRGRNPSTCPKVVITGDFFTRFSPFFMEGVHELYAASGIILKPLSMQSDMPLLTYESDGYAVAPSFLRQVEVHIEQVLQRAALRNLKPGPIPPAKPPATALAIP